MGDAVRTMEEDGEFHTGVVPAPCCRESVRVRRGDVVELDAFVFADPGSGE